ncbi:ATP synthase subunit gamma, mitochondrial-like [Vicia villosa]|uniref:ATP synthase subunit gamma, mitochondrial-like n=1 Tax=Vicia villosa TaxID=3911 RepID=UPI00273C5E16|nr:ATP synthase subunit gamma, mitochondrial-like [Vicia villosa]
MSSQPINNTLRSTLISSLEQTSIEGARSISTQIVRNRMKSAKNIQKITKAMKMVAAAKLRAVQNRAENSRGLWQAFTALLGDAIAQLLMSRRMLLMFLQANVFVVESTLPL